LRSKKSNSRSDSISALSSKHVLAKIALGSEQLLSEKTLDDLFQDLKGILDTNPLFLWLQKKLSNLEKNSHPSFRQRVQCREDHGVFPKLP